MVYSASDIKISKYRMQKRIILNVQNLQEKRRQIKSELGLQCSNTRGITIQITATLQLHLGSN